MSFAPYTALSLDASLVLSIMFNGSCEVAGMVADHHSAPSTSPPAGSVACHPAPTSLRLVFHAIFGIITHVLLQAAECIMSTALCVSLLVYL